MTHGIHHAAISCTDIDRSVHFYRELLGFEGILSFDWQVVSPTLDNITGLKDSAACVVMLKPGNAGMESFEYASPTLKAAESRRPVCDHGITQCMPRGERHLR